MRKLKEFYGQHHVPKNKVQLTLWLPPLLGGKISLAAPTGTMFPTIAPVTLPEKIRTLADAFVTDLMVLEAYHRRLECVR